MDYTKNSLCKIIEKLFREIIKADANLCIIKQLSEYCGTGKKYERVYLDYPGFWTIMSLDVENEIMHTLSKLYDETSASVGIKKLIGICKANMHLFDKEQNETYTDMDTGKPTLYVRKIDMSARMKEAEKTYDHWAEVRGKLKSIRNASIAHNDKNYFFESDKLYKEFPLTYGEIEDLISAAEAICNLFYSALTGAAMASRPSNIDDIQMLLESAYIGQEMRADFYKKKRKMVGQTKK